MTDRYAIWEPGKPLRYVEVLEWAEWFENSGESRRVNYSEIGPYEVSTVFLGLNHALAFIGRPLWFETMVFGSGGMDGSTERYETEEEAREGHERICLAVLDSLQSKPERSES